MYIMKKIGIILVLFLSIGVNAQSIRNQEIIKLILDNHIGKNANNKDGYYSRGRLFYRWTIGYPVESKVCDTLTNLSIDQEEWIYNYLLPYANNDSLFNLKIVGYNLLRNMAHNSKHIKIRQKVMEEVLLGPARLPHSWQDVKDVVYDFRKEDYTERSKQRLKDIFLGNLTEKEIEIHLKYRKPSEQYILDNIERAKPKNKRARFDVNHLRDSIIVDFEKTIINNKKEPCPPNISNRLILAFGFLDMVEMIPILEDLKDTECKYLKDEITYCLAKLGVKEYKDEIFSKKEFNYRYLGSEDAIYQYFKNNDMAEMIAHPSWPTIKGSRRFFTLFDLQYYILNFPDELKQPRYCGGTFDEEKAMKGYEWIINNKGKLILDSSTFQFRNDKIIEIF